MLRKQYRITGPKMVPDYEYWFRADDRRYANYDPFAEFEQPSGYHIDIKISPYLVTRHTPKGVFVRSWIGPEQFVLGNSIKQLCVPTIQLALYDLMKRKEKHFTMCRYRMDTAEEIFDRVTKMYINEVKENEYSII